MLSYVAKCTYNSTKSFTYYKSANNDTLKTVGIFFLKTPRIADSSPKSLPGLKLNLLLKQINASREIDATMEQESQVKLTRTMV
jgi:hypothetical protein